MKKSISIVALISMLNGILVYGLFVLFLTGGYYQSVLWYFWIILGMLTPVLPVVSKYFRKQMKIIGKVNKILEIIAIILCLFDIALICLYGLNIEYGNEIGWCTLIVVSIVYARIKIDEGEKTKNGYDAKKEDKQEELHREKHIGYDLGTLYCRKCGTKIPGDSIFCVKCGERVVR